MLKIAMALSCTLACTQFHCALAFAQDDAVLKKGRSVAKHHCSRCHVVDDKDPFSGISSTPSFSLMVNALPDWEDRFSSFHNRLPHQSVIRFKGEPIDPEKPVLYAPMEIEYDDIDAIVAFVGTLKKTN